MQIVWGLESKVGDGEGTAVYNSDCATGRDRYILAIIAQDFGRGCFYGDRDSLASIRIVSRVAERVSHGLAGS